MESCLLRQLFCFYDLANLAKFQREAFNLFKKEALHLTSTLSIFVK